MTEFNDSGSIDRQIQEVADRKLALGQKILQGVELTTEELAFWEEQTQITATSEASDINPKKPGYLIDAERTDLGDAIRRHYPGGFDDLRKALGLPTKTSEPSDQ